MKVPGSKCHSSVFILRLHLQGTIPEDWGASGSLPNLQKLTLSFNFELSGRLPAQWGVDASSLQSLTSLEITNCDLSGPLPPDWAGNLPSLTQLNFSANALSGATMLSRLCTKRPPAEAHCWPPGKDLYSCQALISLHASAPGRPLL